MFLGWSVPGYIIYLFKVFWGGSSEQNYWIFSVNLGLSYSLKAYIDILNHIVTICVVRGKKSQLPVKVTVSVSAQMSLQKLLGELCFKLPL